MVVFRRLLLGVLLAAVGGCSIQAMTGDTMSAFTVEQVVPQTMASDDVGMACAGGLGQAQLMEAFGRVTDPEPRASVVTFSSAGMCAEMDGWEAELRRMRALKEGRVAEAQDALTFEKLAHLDAAKRNLYAFQSLERAYGTVGGDACPELDPDTSDRLFYLLGLSSGMLAVVHDRGAGGDAGVPMTVPQAVLRATKCLDVEAWWGMPLALRAAIWTSIPGVLPEGEDPWRAMQQAADAADKSGVGLSYALWVQTAASNGKTPEMCAAVDRYTASLAANPRNPSYRLLDAYAAKTIRHEVNKQWIQSVGYRAPAGALACYKAPTPDPSDDVDLDLLKED
jgi:hypothetical protein